MEANKELYDCYLMLATANNIRKEAEAALTDTDSPSSDYEWMEKAAHYAAVTAEIRKLNAQLAVLRKERV